MQRADKHSQHSSIICPVWLNSCEFIYELIESWCSQYTMLFRKFVPKKNYCSQRIHFFKGIQIFKFNIVKWHWFRLQKQMIKFFRFIIFMRLVLIISLTISFSQRGGDFLGFHKSLRTKFWTKKPARFKKNLRARLKSRPSQTRLNYQKKLQNNSRNSRTRDFHEVCNQIF